jgi:glutathione reductase (NADPH)
MPKRVAIIGSGYIAVEFAGIFAGLGAQTHLVYRQPLPLRGFDEEMRIGLAEALGANGITQYPSQPPVRIVEAGAERHLYLADGMRLEVDLVFFATGRAPNIRGLGLEQAGVATAGNGAIVVDGALDRKSVEIGRASCRERV